MGVYPFVVPLFPLVERRLEHHPAPTPEYMHYS